MARYQDVTHHDRVGRGLPRTERAQLSIAKQWVREPKQEMTRLKRVPLLLREDPRPEGSSRQEGLHLKPARRLLGVSESCYYELGGWHAGCVALTGPISQTQLRILQWVAEGCPAAAVAGNGHKVTANALASRRLVTVTRVGGKWSAELTAAGRHYLNSGTYPAGHWTTQRHRQPAAMSQVKPPNHCSNTGPGSAESAKENMVGDTMEDRRPPPATTARRSAERRTAATTLVEELLAEGYKLVRGLDDDGLAQWRKIIDFAKRHAMVPEGHWIEKHQGPRGDLRIVLCKGVHPNTGVNSSRTDEVPETHTDLHPLLAELSDPTTAFDVSTESLPRVLQFLHCLLVECDARGFTTSWSPEKRDGIQVQVDRLDARIMITEEPADEQVMPSPEKLASRKLYAWQRITLEQKTVAGRLTVALLGNSRYDRNSWSDGKRQRIENKLTAVVDRIAERAQGLAEFHAQQERLEQERQRKQQAALDRARKEFLDKRQIDTLSQQLSDWHKAADIRAYCEARTQAAVADNDPASVADLAQWLAWCRAFADRIDPVIQQPPGPPPTQPSQTDLQPFLPPWMRSRW